MKFYIDLTTRQFVRGPASGPLATTFFKRRDAFEIEIIFVDRAAIVPTPAGTSFLAGVKAHFGGDFLALSDSTGLLNLHTTAVEALFADEPEKVAALFEVKSSRPGEETRTHTLAVEIQNAVILGDESLPIDSPSLKASQADAQAGLDNTKWMTPLRTAEAIAALAPSGGGGSSVTWSTLTGKPSTFPPSSHSHAISEVTGLDTALAGKQPAGSYATSAQGALADTASQPGHTHSTSQITGLDTSLAAKITGTGVAAIEVVQSLPATLVPTTFYILIPSGATAATSVQLGSIPLFTGSGGGGNDIVTSGLQFHIDAGNSVSYSGTGTAWNDLSVNQYAATLVNGPTFAAQNSGSIILDAVDDYISTNYQASLGDFTLSVWFRPASTSNAWATFIEIGGLRIIARESNGFAWFTLPSGNNANNLKLSNIFMDTWHCITLRRDGTMWSLRTNDNANIVSFDYGTAALSGNLQIGRGNGAYFGGRISILQIYNRALTDAEIQQNFDARKSRFGL